MKTYCDYTETYVQDICDALNEAGFKMRDETGENVYFSPDNFETLTKFLHRQVVMPMNSYIYLNERGLVNRGRCPYTGERIDDSFPNWTYMRTRKVTVSHDGYRIMQREDNENYEKTFGKPAPPIKENKCYIATVCYGNEFAPEVLILKSFRDTTLEKYLLGRLFIKAYYLFSPPCAKFLKNQNQLNDFIKKNILNKIISKIR